MTDDLDRIIDDVARQMTSAPPDAELARRVSARVAEAGHRRSAWVRPWVLVPIASAAVVLLAIFVARDQPVRDAVRLKPDATPVERVQPSVGQAPVVGRPFQGRQAGPERPGLQRATAPELPPPAIAPLEVDRLVVPPLVEMSAIEISPIAFDRIEISAMP